MSETLEPPIDMSDADYSPDDFDQPDQEVDENELTATLTTLMNRANQMMSTIDKASKENDPETASVVLVELARANSILAKKSAYAKYIARNADRAARRFRGNTTIELSKTMAVNKAEPMAEEKAKDLFKVASEAQLAADEAVDFGFRVDTFLDMARTRIALIREDVKRA